MVHRTQRLSIQSSMWLSLLAQLMLKLIYRTILLRREAGETMIKDHSTGETQLGL